MDQADQDDTAEADETHVSARRWSMFELEEPLSVLRRGTRLLLEVTTSDGVDKDTADAMGWVINMMTDAHGVLKEAFDDMLEEMRERTARHEAEAERLRALKAAPGSPEDQDAARFRQDLLIHAARRIVETADASGAGS